MWPRSTGESCTTQAHGHKAGSSVLYSGGTYSTDTVHSGALNFVPHPLTPRASIPVPHPCSSEGSTVKEDQPLVFGQHLFLSSCVVPFQCTDLSHFKESQISSDASLKVYVRIQEVDWQVLFSLW